MPLWKPLRIRLKRMWRSPQSPQSLALGVAVGTFWAILPTPGFSIALGITTYLIWKKVSKLGLLVAYAIWNPLVTAPIYSISYQLGNLFYDKNIEITYRITWFSKVLHFTQRFLLGAAIIAAICSFICYWLTIYALTWGKKWKLKHVKVRPKINLEAISSANELDEIDRPKE